MHYISTRGQAPKLAFDDVVLAGLASDGGLYVPETIPEFTAAEITAMRDLSYTELAYRIIAPYVAGTVNDADLKAIIDASYEAFRDPAIAPLKKLGKHDYLLELFHGPTLAFKDFALQFLGRLMDHILKARGEHITIIGATSGDTGSAAIAGCRGRDNMDIFILHPHGRVSDVQRRQMTTIEDANVHNMAIKGNFDDCQDLVKAMFNDQEFRNKHKLGAVNSINWARILAQIVYYFYAALKVGSPEKRVAFSVPTGNFGDIFAGHLAARMGLPVAKLIIATNKNDILNRCVKTGTYGMQGVEPSLSPSMDIQISSNFERMLFDLYERDGNTIRQMMETFKNKKSITLSKEAHTKLTELFDSASIDDEATKQTIKEIHEATGELLDPHSAIGVHAGRQCWKEPSIPLISLATAHPAKFPAAVQEASSLSPELPEHLSDLMQREEKYDVLDNDMEAIKAFIDQRV